VSGQSASASRVTAIPAGPHVRVRQRPRRPRLGPGALGLGLLLVVLAMALAAPLIAGYNPLQQNLALRLQPPGASSGGHIFVLGTDTLGRDIWARVVYGSRVSLSVAAIAVTVSLMLGTLVGVVAGFYRGLLGTVLMRLVDTVLSVPFLLLAVATVAVVGPSFTNLIFALGLTRWPRYARVGYAQTLATRELEFVQAARALGATTPRLLRRHLVPGVLPALAVVATLEIGLMIIFEASLSFLGLGVQPPAPSWGGMLSDGRNYLADAWWLATFPGLAISLTVLAANVTGDWVRDLLDPRRGHSSRL
jgi:peptide/nickel transport system permease protein